MKRVLSILISRFPACMQSRDGSSPMSAFAFLLCFLALPAQMTVAQSTPAAPTRPSAVINVSGVGYPQLSRTERLGDDANVTLDFIDDHHVLLTFNPKKLFTRNPACPPGHDDRMVHAAVLELPGGKVVTESDWYLHDRRRYLWSLGSGHFLLRRLNDLYVLDANLHEKLFLKSPKELLWVSVTPDHNEIVVETAEDAPESPNTESASQGVPKTESAAEENKSKPRFLLQFLDRNSLAPQRTLTLSAPVNLDGTSNGYADAIQKGDVWLIRFGPTPRERRNIARVRSRGVPRIFYSSSNSLLIGRCCSPDDDYSVTSFSLSGHRLWRQRWSQDRYYPVVADSADESRFAVSTLRHIPYSATTGVGDDNPDFGLEQNVQIIETATGTLLRSISVSPVMTGEQNFAISPDGRSLAVLGESQIKVYDLPAMSSQEHEKYAALKADSIYVLSDSTASEPTPAPAAVASNEAVPELPKQQQQQPAPAPAPTTVTATPDKNGPIPTFKASTQAVLVDVVVTDAKGHPVKGLDEHDFHLREDGVPQPIRYFHEYSASDIPKPKDPPLAKHNPNVFSNTVERDPGPLTLIMLDLLNTPSTDQVLAQQQLIKFLRENAKKTTATQIALCTLGEAQDPHLQMLQGFTGDERLLENAAGGKKGTPKPAQWQVSQADLDSSISQVKQLLSDDRFHSWVGLLHGLEAVQAQEQLEDTDARVSITSNAMMQLAQYLSGIPGRKNLIWLSGSFPVSFFNNDSLNPVSTYRNYSGLVQETARMLAESQVAVYPVDVRGLTNNIGVADNEVGLAPHGPGMPADIGTPAPNGELISSPYSDFEQKQLQGLALTASERTSIGEIAENTGGKAFYSANDIAAAIETASEQGSNYYTISYNPANKNYNGRFRKIRISLSEKGYHLSYRLGYFALDPDSPLRNREVAHNMRVVAMEHGSPLSHQIHFSARVVPIGTKMKVAGSKIGEIRPVSATKSDVPSEVKVQHHNIDYVIESSDVRFLPLVNGTYRSALTFMVASFDADGRPLAGVSSVGTSDLKPDEYKDALRTGVRVHQEVDIPENAASIRIGIQDQLSNYVGTVDIALPVPVPPDEPRVVKNRLPDIEPN
ncbi:MAG TPA: VWA domain-containing protein [Terriglobales bacterium]|nr:VWA domain-containing protein [Terriglobales bacterium]